MSRSTSRHFVDLLRHILIVFLLIGIASQVCAFDGHRKGFILGGGIGFAPVSEYERLDMYVQDRAPSAVADIWIGHGFSERNSLVVDWHLAPRWAERIPDMYIVQEFLGISWHHYISEGNRSFFTSFGLGLVALVAMDLRHNKASIRGFNYYYNSAGSGLGFSSGIGYKFSRHFQISGNYTSGGFDVIDGTHTSVTWSDVTLTFVLF